MTALKVLGGLWLIFGLWQTVTGIRQIMPRFVAEYGQVRPIPLMITVVLGMVCLPAVCIRAMVRPRRSPEK